MCMSKIVMLFLITLVCITCALGADVSSNEIVQNMNETEFDFYNKTECHCGENSYWCYFRNGTKECDCHSGYIQHNGMCTECDCGNAFSCRLDINGEKECDCNYGLKVFNGTCLEPCSWDKDCENGRVCKEVSRGQSFCLCPPNFKGKDCEIPEGKEPLCEKLEKLCRDMGADCVVKNSEAFCRCPWGKTVGLPSGICEDLCNPDKCFHGRCEFVTNSKVERNYRCICDEGYTGLRCETKIQDEPSTFVRFAILVSIDIVLFILISAMFCYMCCNRK